MRVYIAGPMRNFPLYNFPKFHEAAAFLRERGHDVFSPAERDLQDGFDPEIDKPLPLTYYMKIDIPAVCDSDAVVVLPGWQDSDGANMEVFVALGCGLPVLEYPTLEPVKPMPQFIAYQTVRAVMAEGAKKHPSESWREEQQFNHVGKAARHLLSYELIRNGLSPEDKEEHLSNAICRAAFAKAQAIAAQPTERSHQ